MATNPTNSTNSTNPTLVEVFTEMFRAIARPAVTVIFAAVIAEAAVTGANLPEWFLALAIPTITWWFAERTITHVQERKNDQKD
jgi:hypothetical protein